MKSKKILFTKLIAAAFLSLILITAKSQNCQDNYNKTLSYYNKGQFENIEDYLAGCINEFQNNKKEAGANLDLVFKVYKLIINSYKNIDKDNLANDKLNELVAFLHDIGQSMTRDDVQDRLDKTNLSYIK